MDTFLYALSLLLATLGLVVVLVTHLPALAISVVSLLLLLLSSTSPITILEVVILAALAALATASSRYLSPIITQRWGGSRLGYWGGVIGILAGFMLYPPTGVVLCPLFGSVLGELLYDKSDVMQAYKRGFSSFGSLLVGRWLEFLVALWILWMVKSAVFATLVSDLGLEQYL